MKSVNRSKRQSGFFDLGISLIVLAVAGGVVYGVENSRGEQVAVEQAQGAELQASASGSMSAKVDPDSALQ